MAAEHIIRSIQQCLMLKSLIGEQFCDFPRRKKKTARTMSLATKRREATCVGFDNLSHEHLVVLAKGDMALKVSTVNSRAELERWSQDAIYNVVATPDGPNPKDPSQQVPRGVCETNGAETEGDGGHRLPKAPVRHQEGFVRDFRITDKIIEKF